ncbi:MAG: ABC transporter permease [Tissierellia bacterium]|nr:ABC transporter permease [Tissierellia bacterium]
MSKWDLLLMSLRNLWRRRLRTTLTILGVVIGCASIIVMLSLGFGMKKSLEQQIEEMGDVDILRIVPYPIYNEETQGQKDAAPLDDKAVKFIESIEHVKGVLPTMEVRVDGIITKKYGTYGEVIGVDPKAMVDFGFSPAWGRLLEEGDMATAVFGGQIKSNWEDYTKRRTRRRYGNYHDQLESPVDLQKDRIFLAIGAEYDANTERRTFQKTFRINVVGELPEDDWRTSWNVYVPMDFAMKLQREIKKIQDKQRAEGTRFWNDGNKKGKYSQILVLSENIKYMRDIQEQLKDANFNVQSNLQYIDAISKTINNQRKILGGIGAVSLVVAAIGIANTMVMSIYERIKEIGVMKVIGASIKDIKQLFLTEAALIGLFGGIFGVGLSYIISAVLNHYAGKGGDGMMGMPGMMGPMGEAARISIIPFWLVGLALLFSSLIGILSGYYPARKATKLSPLDAIRTQ